MCDTHDDEIASAGELLRILTLEPIEQNLYRGESEVRGPFRLSGGQVLAQALRAACHTVEGADPGSAAAATAPGRAAHSLRAYFMRAGDAERPVLYEVERIRDGSSFSTRRVVAIQQGDAIFSMDVSFQIAEDGYTHHDLMPNVPPPEELEDDLAVFSRLTERHPGLPPMAGRARPFQTRSVFPPGSPDWQQKRYWNPMWIRFCGAAPPNDGTMARALLAYASDMGLVSTALLPHHDAVGRSDLQIASLDHALWFHREFAMDDWLLFHKRTTVAEGSRGLIHAEFFSREGTLVASVTQEGLVRVREVR